MLETGLQMAMVTAETLWAQGFIVRPPHALNNNVLRPNMQGVGLEHLPKKISSPLYTYYERSTASDKFLLAIS